MTNLLLLNQLLRQAAKGRNRHQTLSKQIIKYPEKSNSNHLIGFNDKAVRLHSNLILQIAKISDRDNLLKHQQNLQLSRPLTIKGFCIREAMSPCFIKLEID